MGPRRDRATAVLACSLLGCTAIGVFGAPAWTEHTDILVGGVGARDATAALMSALRRRGAGAGFTLIAAAASIRIEDRVPGAPFGPADRGVGRALAAQAIDEMQAAAALVSGGPDPATPDPFPIATVAERRAGLEAEFASADRDATTLSASLTDVARDLAAAQRLDAAQADASTLPVRGMIAQLQAKRADLAARYTAQFPAVAITDDEIAQLHGLLSSPAPRVQSSALSTLRAEQARLVTALTAADTRRDTADRRLRDTDAVLKVGLEAPRPERRVAPPPVSYAVLDSGATKLPDPRPGACAAVVLAGLVTAWLTRGRLRGGTKLSRLETIERQVRLPVLRCLDVHGVALALDRPTIAAHALRLRAGERVQLSAT